MLNDSGIDRDDRLFETTQIEPEGVAEGFVVAGQNLHGIAEHGARIRKAAPAGNNGDRSSGGHTQPSGCLAQTAGDFISFVGSDRQTIGKDKMLRISFRSPAASRVSDDAGLPESWWGAAGTGPQTLRRFASRSW